MQINIHMSFRNCGLPEHLTISATLLSSILLFNLKTVLHRAVWASFCSPCPLVSFGHTWIRQWFTGYPSLDSYIQSESDIYIHSSWAWISWSFEAFNGLSELLFLFPEWIDCMSYIVNAFKNQELCTYVWNNFRFSLSLYALI